MDNEASEDWHIARFDKYMYMYTDMLDMLCFGKYVITKLAQSNTPHRYLGYLHC